MKKYKIGVYTLNFAAMAFGSDIKWMRCERNGE